MYRVPQETIYVVTAVWSKWCYSPLIDSDLIYTKTDRVPFWGTLGLNCPLDLRYLRVASTRDITREQAVSGQYRTGSGQSAGSTGQAAASQQAVSREDSRQCRTVNYKQGTRYTVASVTGTGRELLGNWPGTLREQGGKVKT